MRQFLGLVGVYRKYINNFADKARVAVRLPQNTSWDAQYEGILQSVLGPHRFFKDDDVSTNALQRLLSRTWQWGEWLLLLEGVLVFPPPPATAETLNSPHAWCP